MLLTLLFKINTYNMGLFNKDIELIIPPKKRKQNTNNDKTINVKSLNGYDAIRDKLDEGNTLSVKAPVQEKPKQK